MNSSPSRFIVLALSVFSANLANAALTVTLHPDGEGGVVVAFSGSGITDPVENSQLANGTSFSEQWINMTGNPFNDAVNVDNSVHMLTTPIQLADGVFITGIEVDNDNTGPLQDEFRIFISANMSLDTPYSIDGYSTLVEPLSYAALNVGSYTDDDDGGTNFLNGFTLVVSDTVIPEPSVFALGGLAGLAALVRRRRH